MDQLPRLGKRELICLLLFTCNYVVFVWRGFLFLWVLGMSYVILLWRSLSLPYNYFENGKSFLSKYFWSLTGDQRVWVIHYVEKPTSVRKLSAFFGKLRYASDDTVLHFTWFGTVRYGTDI